MIAQREIDIRPATATAPVEMPTGAEMLIQALVHEGVDTIFGYPGGAVLHIYDELWRARHRNTHYLVRHEKGAVHTAEGYDRAPGGTDRARSSWLRVMPGRRAEPASCS